MFRRTQSARRKAVGDIQSLIDELKSLKNRAQSLRGVAAEKSIEQLNESIKGYTSLRDDLEGLF